MTQQARALPPDKYENLSADMKRLFDEEMNTFFAGTLAEVEYFTHCLEGSNPLMTLALTNCSLILKSAQESWENR